jgi:hypothetical protein
MDEFSLYLVLVVPGIIIGAVVGALIGQLKGRAGAGMFFGLLLGPIGWLIVAVGPNLMPKCPECGGVIVEGARKCKNCGSVLPQNEQATEMIENEESLRSSSEDEEKRLQEAYDAIVSSEEENKGSPLSDEEKDKIVCELYHDSQGVHLSGREKKKLRIKFEEDQSED